MNPLPDHVINLKNYTACPHLASDDTPQIEDNMFGIVDGNFSESCPCSVSLSPLKSGSSL